MRILRLRRPVPPNMPGEIAGFPDHIADRLLAAGAAEALNAAPVAAEPEPVTVAAVQAAPVAAVMEAPAKRRPGRPARIDR